MHGMSEFIVQIIYPEPTCALQKRKRPNATQVWFDAKIWCKNSPRIMSRFNHLYKALERAHPSRTIQTTTKSEISTLA